MPNTELKKSAKPQTIEKLSPESCTSMEDLAQFITQMKFRKKTFGGVSELSVLRQMEELQKAYRSVMNCQEAYYRALLEEKDREIERLKGKAADQ